MSTRKKVSLLDMFPGIENDDAPVPFFPSTHPPRRELEWFDLNDPQRNSISAWLARHRDHLGQLVVVRKDGETIKREAHCRQCKERFEVPA